jgi:hypothetical protein
MGAWEAGGEVIMPYRSVRIDSKRGSIMWNLLKFLQLLIDFCAFLVHAGASIKIFVPKKASD